VLQTLQSRAQAILTNRTARQAAQMTALRFIGLGIGAVAQIYAARQLGPEKLGISGMAIAAFAQGSIIANLGANTLLVREYKAATTQTEKRALIDIAFTLRTLVSLALLAAILAATPWLLEHPQFILSTACVLPMIFFDSNHALWVLQAEERVPAQYIANLASALVTALIIFIFITPNSPAGSDMVAAVFGMLAAFCLSWHYALRGLPRWRFNRHRIGGLLKATKWLFLTAVVTYGYTRLDQPLLGWLRSLEDLGIYRAAFQISNALQPLFSMVPLLLYPKLIQWRSESMASLWHHQKRVLRTIAPWCLIFSAATFLTAPVLLPLVYGEKFANATWPSAMLLSGKAIGLLGSIYIMGLWAVGRDRTIFSIIAAVAVVSVVLNFLLIPRFGVLASASISLASEVAIFLAALCAMKSLVTTEGPI
jgi:O-antigen/teichoic acid export membrane protein